MKYSNTKIVLLHGRFEAVGRHRFCAIREASAPTMLRTFASDLWLAAGAAKTMGAMVAEWLLCGGPCWGSR